MLECKRFRATDLVLVAPARDHFRGRAPMIGERVALVSGGPVLTIVDIGENSDVIVAWDAGRHVIERTIPAICLIPIDHANG